MARKYDRYGRNRQFRRNPTRGRKFFPNQLPFQDHFRLKSSPTDLKPQSDSAARRMRETIDAFEPSTRKRSREFINQYGRHLLDLGELGLLAIVGPEMSLAVPIMGLEAILQSKRSLKERAALAITAPIIFRA
jgi:hypothetical protein